MSCSGSRLRVCYLFSVFLIFFSQILQFSSVADTATDSPRFGLGGNNQVFTKLSEAEKGSAVTLQISGGTSIDVIVELVDIYANEDGVKLSLPLNSTPYTSAGHVEFEKNPGRYTPNGAVQKIEIPFRFINLKEVTTPLLGGLKVSLAESNAATGGIQISASIVSTFAYYPLGVQRDSRDEIRASLASKNLQLIFAERGSFLSRLIPDLPRIRTHLPIAARFDLTNVGNIFLEVDTEMRVIDSEFFNSSARTELAMATTKETMLIPNQSSQLQNTFRYGEEDQITEESQPAKIGLYRLEIVSEGKLGNQTLTRTTKSQWFIIFPWKSALAWLLVAFLLWFLVLRRYRIIRAHKERVVREVEEPEAGSSSFDQDFSAIISSEENSRERFSRKENRSIRVTSRAKRTY